MERVLRASRQVVREAIARAGIFAVAFAISVPLIRPSVPAESRPVSVASAVSFDTDPAALELPRRARELARSEVVAASQAAPEAREGATPDAHAESPPPARPPEPAKTAPPAPPPLPAPPLSGLVLASWYGPGFFGNRTACGQTYTPEIMGVAHRSLPCGTLMTLEYRGRVLTVPVIDRGPFIAGRTLDLSNATRLALGCPDICTLSMRLGP